ncbi:putative nucleotidyltransferase substrate binding domain-containing protein [Hydrogenobacter thermophilus]|uniref:putative nucleotidyltransferase substrate binding domain-containing protein n=1 Tax=Hydrogenobacter thermophilus TaxID=940 RepID=UPI0030F64754
MLDPERFLKETYPFDRLPEEEIKRISSNLLVRYYSKGETIFTEGSPPLEFLYVIRKGAVVLKRDRQNVDYLHEGDSFGYISLLGNTTSSSTAVATEDTILFMIPKPIFLRLVKDYEDLRNFYTNKLVNRIRKEKTTIRIGFERLANLPVGKIKLSPPLFVEGEESLSEVILKMVREGLTFAFVRDGDAVGIITERDIIRKVLAEGHDPKQRKAKDIASFPLIEIDADALLFDALLLMAKHNIRRLAVRDRGKIVGVLEDRDIISYESKNLLFLIKDIGRAKSIEDLAYIYSLVFQVAVEYITEGADPELVGRYISEINDKIMQRVVFLTIKEMGAEPPTAFGILVLGSEGRKEQSLKTDQDNALIYEDRPMLDISAKKYFEEFSDRYIKNLLKIGFPPCPGGVMLSNPVWRKSLEEWIKQVDMWIENPKGQHTLNVSIFFDFRGVFGSQSLVEELREHVLKKVSDNPVFLAFLASQAARFRVPLGFFRGFVVEKSGEHKGEFDIKAGGVLPIVQGVRVLALEHKIRLTNTFERIRELSSEGVISERFSRDLEDAYKFLMGLRLRFQAQEIIKGKEPTNYINPQALSRAERSVLKDVFGIVEELQNLLRHRYQLRYFM